MLGNFAFFVGLVIFLKITFSTNLSGIPRECQLPSMEPDQARHFARPVQGLNCLQRLSTDDTSRESAYDYSTLSVLLMKMRGAKRANDSVV